MVSGTSSLLGGSGNDTLIAGGDATQWYLDAGDDNDSISLANASDQASPR